MNLSFSIDWTELSIQWMLTSGHFLWQGLVVAFVYFVIERLAATRASTRYALACAALLSLPICVMLTFAFVHNSRGDVLKKTSPSLVNALSLNDSVATGSRTLRVVSPIDSPGNITALPQTWSDRPVNSDAATPQPASLAQHAIFLAPMIAAAYAIVVGLLLLRTSLSLFRSCRIGNAGQRVTDSQLLQVVSAQATRLKLKTIPIVATCMRVSSPVVVGILRPMILLPPSLICGLDPIQLAAILSHEMAHIRRYDLLFNLLQRVIESLFFFHPIVWWLSRRVTIERENCCDDVAALYVGRLTYAEALVQMATLCLAKHRSRSEALATLAADGGNSTDFGYRIRRLIDAQETPHIRITKRSFAFCLTTLVLLGTSLVTLAQSPQLRKDELQVKQPSQNSLIDGIRWSTWGDRDGLLSGARLILPEGGVHPGQPVVVEYRLKNVTAETKKFTCFIRSNWQCITLESKNWIRDWGIDTTDKSIEVTIEPGEEFVATSHTATIDTRGLSPGDYQVALGTAFWLPDTDNPGAKHGIPHRGSIPLTILGEAKAAPARPLDNNIHWGDAISGMRLGAKFRYGANSFAVGDLVEADLWLANVTDQAVECSIRLPHPMDGWLFNVENHLGDTIMLERPPMMSSPLPQQFYKFELAPGEVKALTGDRVEGQPDSFAGRRAKFEIVSKKEDQGWGDYTIKGRLVTQGGNYAAIYNVMLERPDIPGLRIKLDSGNYPFTVGQPHVNPIGAQVLDEATNFPVQPKAAPPINTTALQPQGAKLAVEVRLPKDDWLFRRQVKQLSDMLPSERPRDFKGDTIDAVDGRLVHELTWKDVVAINVTVKANDGRDYSRTVQTDQRGKFDFKEVLPLGNYQIDVNAVLTMDDDAQSIDGEPAPDLRAGTQLLNVRPGDVGNKSLAFELFPVPYNHRVVHADPAQRTALLGTLTENNQPVSNAKIILYGGIATRWKIAESLTDPRGRYRFENVRGDYIGVQVKHERLVPADGKSWRDIRIEFGTNQRLDLPLIRGGSITGKLLDDNKQPRAGVPLRIMLTAPGVRKASTNFLAYATTDDTGCFTSEPLYPGRYVIEENRDSYPVVGEVEVEANQTTKL